MLPPVREVASKPYCEYMGCKPGFCLLSDSRRANERLLTQFHQMAEAQENCRSVQPWDQGVQKWEGGVDTPRQVLGILVKFGDLLHGQGKESGYAESH